MTTPWTITVDCVSATRLAEFWATALGYVPADPPEGWDSWEAWLVDLDVPEAEWDDGASIVDPEGVRPRIGFLKVPEGKTVKNRLHLDLHVSGGRHRPPEEREALIRAEVERLLPAGARVVTEGGHDGHLDHVVMADPEGHEFCVV